VSVLTDGESLSVLYDHEPSDRVHARAAAVGVSDARFARVRELYKQAVLAGEEIDFGDDVAFGRFCASVSIRIVSNDPGRLTIATMVEALANGTIAKWSLSFATWENKTCALKRRTLAAHWMRALDSNPVVVAARALSPKTPDGDDFLAWAAADAAATDAVLAEKLKPRWSNARFRAWQLRGKVLREFFGMVRAGRLADGTAGVAPIVFYGDARFGASSRGRRSGPTTAVFAACVAVMGAANVVLTSEFMTTKACPGCGAVLQDVYHDGQSARERARAAARAERFAEAGGPARRPPRGPLWRDSLSVRRCVNFCGGGDFGGGAAPCARAGRLVSRDGSAARHIGIVGMMNVCGLDLPAYLRPTRTKRAKPPALRVERTAR